MIPTPPYYSLTTVIVSSALRYTSTHPGLSSSWLASSTHFILHFFACRPNLARIPTHDFLQVPRVLSNPSAVPTGPKKHLLTVLRCTVQLRSSCVFHLTQSQRAARAALGIPRCSNRMRAPTTTPSHSILPHISMLCFHPETSSRTSSNLLDAAQSYAILLWPSLRWLSTG